MQLTVFHRYEYSEVLLMREVNRYHQSGNLVLRLPRFNPLYVLYYIYAITQNDRSLTSLEIIGSKLVEVCMILHAKLHLRLTIPQGVTILVTVMQLNEYKGWYELVVLMMYKQILKNEWG